MTFERKKPLKNYFLTISENNLRDLVAQFLIATRAIPDEEVDWIGFSFRHDNTVELDVHTKGKE